MPNTGRTTSVLATLAWAVTAAATTAPPAGDDAVAYLVNVTVRPGYNFAGPDQTIAYGHGICEQVDAGSGYRDLVARIKFDFATSGDFKVPTDQPGGR
ncbi:DUF732 domain-containing protein [Mycolicibacterium stellerae]|uniref:DUF732 domain-containing protein n=1 Tax=Mycolicibacterium stellerae TaxID=2358193 RepID=UPI000F0B80C8|nr:DUF732 domain-containing protein [Mycolicibacterium stellerae]